MCRAVCQKKARERDAIRRNGQKYDRHVLIQTDDCASAWYTPGLRQLDDLAEESVCRGEPPPCLPELCRADSADSSSYRGVTCYQVVLHLRAASMKPKSLQTSVSKGGARAESFLVSLLVL